MATYYVGPGGNDGNNGLTWAQRKLTLNGAEDIPVVAADVVYVGPGVYRELLTVDVSGNAGNPITYIGDVTGEHTDGVGGIMRITGSDNDQTAVRARCINAAGRDYRTFRGFLMDMPTGNIIRAVTNPDHWIVEDCVFRGGTINAVIYFSGDAHSDNTVRRCLFLNNAVYGVEFESAAGIGDVNDLVENCFFVGSGGGVDIDDTGGVDVRNCTFDTGVGVRITDALPGGYTACTVNNSIFVRCTTATRAVNLGELVENFNSFWLNATDRTNVAVGANSNDFPPLFSTPLLHSGASQVSGFRFPIWFFGELSEWSQVKALTGSAQPSIDLFGIGRPTDPVDRSWGALQFMDAERDTGTVHGGASSLGFREAGRKQIYVPTTNVQTIIATWVYRGTGYVGTNPQMVIKQPGVANRVTTDAGGAGGWNQITDTFTPAADPPYVVVELVSNYGTSTTTSTTSTSTTSTSTTSTSTTTLTSTSTSSTSTTTTSTSTTTTSTSTTTLPYDVYFDDLTVN